MFSSVKEKVPTVSESAGLPSGGAALTDGYAGGVRMTQPSPPMLPRMTAMSLRAIWSFTVRAPSPECVPGLIAASAGHHTSPELYVSLSCGVSLLQLLVGSCQSKVTAISHPLVTEGYFL